MMRIRLENVSAIADEFNDVYAGIGIPSSKPGLRNFFAIRSKGQLRMIGKSPLIFGIYNPSCTFLRAVVWINFGPLNRVESDFRYSWAIFQTFLFNKGNHRRKVLLNKSVFQQYPDNAGIAAKVAL